MQSKLDEAFKACRNSLAIRERLAAADRNKTEWQRDHAVRLCQTRKSAESCCL
jgi:hypothetical protein